MENDYFKKLTSLVISILLLLIFMLIKLNSNGDVEIAPAIEQDYSQIETTEQIEGIGAIQQGEDERQIYLDGFEKVFELFPTHEYAFKFKDNLTNILMEHDADEYMVKNERIEDSKLKLELHTKDGTVLNVETKNTIAIIVPN